MTVRVAVFASGGGTTLQALMDHQPAPPAEDLSPAGEAPPGPREPDWAVSLVVCDRQGTGAEKRATAAGIPTAVISDRGRRPAEVAAETTSLLEEHGIQAVCLAGYLRLVPEAVVAEYEGRMLNVHPALLPAFGGKGMYGDRVHTAVLGSGARISGPTVHLVDTEYDRGMPLAQWPVDVRSDDALEDLRGRVQAAERALFPVVVDHLATAIAEGRRVGPLDLQGDGFGVRGGPGGDVRSAIQHAYRRALTGDGGAVGT